MALVAKSARIIHPQPLTGMARGIVVYKCSINKRTMKDDVYYCVDLFRDLRGTDIEGMGYSTDGQLHVFATTVSMRVHRQHAELDKAKINLLPGDNRVSFTSDSCDTSNAIQQLKNKCTGNGCPAGVAIRCGSTTWSVWGDYQGSDWKEALFDSFKAIYAQTETHFNIRVRKNTPKGFGGFRDLEHELIRQTKVPEQIKVSVFASSHANAAMLGSMTIKIEADKVTDGGCEALKIAFSTCLSFLSGPGFILLVGAARGIASHVNCG